MGTARGCRGRRGRPGGLQPHLLQAQAAHRVPPGEGGAGPSPTGHLATSCQCPDSPAPTSHPRGGSVAGRRPRPVGHLASPSSSSCRGRPGLGGAFLTSRDGTGVWPGPDWGCGHRGGWGFSQRGHGAWGPLGRFGVLGSWIKTGAWRPGVPGTRGGETMGLGVQGAEFGDRSAGERRRVGELEAVSGTESRDRPGQGHARMGSSRSWVGAFGRRGLRARGRAREGRSPKAPGGRDGARLGSSLRRGTEGPYRSPGTDGLRWGWTGTAVRLATWPAGLGPAPRLWVAVSQTCPPAPQAASARRRPQPWPSEPHARPHHVTRVPPPVQRPACPPAAVHRRPGCWSSPELSPARPPTLACPSRGRGVGPHVPPHRGSCVSERVGGVGAAGCACACHGVCSPTCGAPGAPGGACLRGRATRVPVCAWCVCTGICASA